MIYWVELNSQREVIKYFECIKDEEMVGRPGVWWKIDMDSKYYLRNDDVVTHLEVQLKLKSILRDKRIDDILKL